MTKAEYRVLLFRQDSILKYIHKQLSVMDYVSHAPKEECGFCVPRGVLVCCDDSTLHKLQSHAKRYYPSMTVIPMASEQYIYRTMWRNNHDSI